jgi:hypothetical protein
MQNKMIRLFSLVLAGLFLAGCASLLHPLPDNEATYYRQKIEPALGSNDCITAMQVLMVKDHKRLAIITLNMEPMNAETNCLKAIRALSRDPLIPPADLINVKVVCSAGSRVVQQALPTYTVMTKYGPMTGPQRYASETVAATKTVFSCVITREALIGGENPDVVIRDGIYVSGPNLGEPAND